MTDSDGTAHPVFAALYDPVMELVGERLLREHREYLARDLTGRVLDLGAGTGGMFPHFATSRGRVDLHAVEPDPYMRRRAAERAGEVGIDVHLAAGRAERLPYADDSFDAVVAAVVFCTIPDVATAVDEVARVLRPGGEFRFLEHVRADGATGRVQQAVTPLWRRAAGGCHLDRATGDLLTSDERFAVVDADRLRAGVFPVTPFVRGRLRRR